MYLLNGIFGSFGSVNIVASDLRYVLGEKILPSAYGGKLATGFAPEYDNPRDSSR